MAVGDVARGTSTFRAPGRVNLIGDHTDYQEGLVLPIALRQEVRVTTSVGGDRVRVRSAGFEGELDVAADASDGPGAPAPRWGRYVAGVVWALAAHGRPAVGVEADVTSTLPAGAGLGSSAALEVALATALVAAARWSIEPMDLAKACRRAEAEGAGVACGIMDQAVAVLGSPDGALLLDCRTLDHDDVRLPASHRVVVVDSGVTRELARSGYAQRRAETEEGLALIRRARPEVRSLRDATLDMIDPLPDRLRRRCRHVVTENARVRETVRALRNRNVATAGRVLDHSHRSLSRDFESSHPEVDALVARLRNVPGVVGARLTGGGFGGMVVALVEAGRADDVTASVAPLPAFVAEPSAGAGEVA